MRWAFACVTLALVGVRGSVEWNQELFGCGAEAGRPRKYGVPVVAPHPRTHPLTRRVTGVAPRHCAGLGAAPPPAGVRGRCTHLPQVWRQVWLRGAELWWAQRGSDPESGGGGDELGFEVGTSQGRLRGFQEPSLEAEHLKVSAVDPRRPPEPGCHSAERWWPCPGLRSHRGSVHLGPNLPPPTKAVCG